MDGAAKQVIEAMKPLAHKVGEGAEALYRIYVKLLVPRLVSRGQMHDINSSQQPRVIK